MWSYDRIPGRIRDAFDDAVKDKRIKNQTEFGKLIGTTQATVSDILNGKREVTITELFKIASVLNQDPIYLLTGYEFDNHSIAEELDLTNESINILRQEKEIYSQYYRSAPYHKLPHAFENPIRKVLDVLLKNTPFLIMIHNYLFGNTQELFVFEDGYRKQDFVKAIEDGELSGIDDLEKYLDEYHGMMVLRPEDVFNVKVKSFSNLFRLEIMDALKKIKDEYGSNGED